MNRLILIGNGFDLAHKMKTSYNDFILWYLKYAFQQALDTNTFEDEILSVRPNFFQEFKVDNIRTIPDYINYYYQNGFEDLILNRPLETRSVRYSPFFSVRVKSKFFKDLLTKCSFENWVDVENEYYKQLKIILTVYIRTDEGPPLRELNTSFKHIINLLEEYLSSLEKPNWNDDYLNLLKEPILPTDIVTFSLDYLEEPFTTEILNFNYTSTIEHYTKKLKLSNNRNYNINYIHGELNDSDNKLIFGFGDELDEQYLKMQDGNNKGFLEHIKSFWYFKTSNYHNLIRFLDSYKFQVYIWGHSCGLSDRTMLNMVFEHKNCMSIKIYYHETIQENNYTLLTQEISKHFRDKAEMRKKIVPFDKSNSLPQINN